MKIIAITLCFLLLGCVLSQNCGSTDPSDKMQSGIIFIYLGTQTLARQNPGHPRLHTYNIPINAFQVTNVGFEVAVCNKFFYSAT